jgi:hypothetical protein
LSVYEIGIKLKAWNAAMYILLLLIGLWVQFRYADRWDGLATKRPAKTRPEEDIPNIFPGADTESHTGFGYADGPDESAEEEEVSAGSPPAES